VNADAVVIGSGASGLVCARILAKEGKRVLVAEKHARLGGYLQRFYRQKIPFDTGFHYTGRLGPRGTLRRYLEYLGVMDELRFHALDPDGFDRIRLPGLSFAVPAGRERYRERLVAQFPTERVAIERYLGEVARVSAAFPLYSLDGPGDEKGYQDLVAGSLSLATFLDSITRDEGLKSVLAGQSFLHGTPPSRVPFWVHALVTDSFIQDGAFGLDGGGDALARALSRKIKAAGGEVRLKDGVRRILVSERTVTGVELDSGEQVEAPVVVAAIHPRRVLELLPEGSVTPAYASRVRSLEESVSSLGLYFRMNRRFEDVGASNLYWYRTSDRESPFREASAAPGGPGFLFATWPSVRDRSWRYPDNMIVLTTVQQSEVFPRWESLATGDRSREYEAWKARAGEAVVATLEREMPGFRGSCDLLTVSTPLTNRDYTGSHLGGNYGVLQSLEQQGIYKLSVRTRIKGLYLTGQSLGLMGIVGVTITAFRTAGEILGQDRLLEKVRRG
jgi:all-trans-retinol 13,14-reductase